MNLMQSCSRCGRASVLVKCPLCHLLDPDTLAVFGSVQKALINVVSEGSQLVVNLDDS